MPSRSRRFLTAAALAAAPVALPARNPAAPPSAGPTGTLVVSNMNDHTVTVLDAATGRVHATLATGQGPHEVAVSRDGRWALVSNYGVRGAPGGTLTVVDVARATVARVLSLGGFERPHGLAFLPGDTLAVVTAEAARALLVVDVRDGRVVDTLHTRGRGSHMVAVPARADRAYTSNVADGTVSALDLRRGRRAPASRGRDSTRLIAVGRAPEGIAVTPDGRQLWVGSNRDSTVLVVDAARAVAVDTLRGFGLPYRIAITPDGRLAVITDPVRAEVRVVGVADRRTRFTVAVPADSVVATAEVPGSPSPEGVALSRDGRWAFVTLQGRNRVATIDLGRGVITAYAPTGSWSDGIGVSPLRRASPAAPAPAPDAARGR
jgi:YVTN family beta-propeller protein